METSPLVTVICTTYAHEQYIGQALEGFISQKTTFPFCVYVGDDCSPDGTAAIVQRYAEKYPSTIIPFLRTSNLGAGRNLVDLISHATSPYLAFCDGDDYWSDPLKLQKQVDYMELHPEYRGCFHDAEISIETPDGTWFQSKDFSHTKNGQLLWPSGNIRFFRKASYRLENFIPFGFVHTSSMFIRWDYSITFPDWFFGNGLSDFPLWALQINTGRFGFIDRTMSVHRRTEKGSFNFATRYEFWRKSKYGWLRLDEGMIDFFTRVKPSKSIVRALIARERDDLAKLIKGSIECDEETGTWELLKELEDHVNDLFGIKIAGPYSPSNYERTMREIALAAPLPPYNQSTTTRMMRAKDIIVTAIRTVR